MKVWSKTKNGLRFHYPSRTYYLNVKIGGRGLSKSTGTNFEAEALKFRDEFLAAARQPGADEQAAKLRNGLTLAPYLALYRESLEFRPRLRSPLTLQRKLGEISYIEGRWQEFRGQPLANEDPRKWSVLDLHRFQKFLGEHYCSDLVRKFISTLIIVLKFVEDDVPTFRSPHRHREFCKVGRSRPARLVLPSQEQFVAVLTYIRQKDGSPAREDIADLAEGLAHTGLRIDEARRLRTKHVDLEKGWLHLPKEIVKGKDSAEETGRKVPLGEDARVLFRRLVAQADPDGRIFRAVCCNNALARACEAVGIVRLSNHSLRKWWTTLALQRTRDAKQVAEWLGHKDGGKLVWDTYSHTLEGREEELAEKLNFEWSRNLAAPEQQVA